MGSCYANSAESKAIDAKMKENEMIDASYQKLLFLGPGGSGKSTVFKQLQWLHGGGIDEYEEYDIQQIVFTIHDQIMSQMQDAIKHYLPKHVSDEALQNAIDSVRHHMIRENCRMSDTIADAIQYIWMHDNRLKAIFREHHTNKRLDESTEYFWNDLDRIKALDFSPTKTDIINMRNRTTGIIEKKFTIKKRNLHIFDVGGQKSERKKWIRCFDEVRAVVFVVAISSYNETMFEDVHKNYMTDALQLFQDTIHHKMFTETPIILFLNKRDLFAEKIKTVPITVCPAFDDYDGDKDANDYEQTTTFIKDKFEQIDELQPTSRAIYTHITCAMDDENVDSVFTDISFILFQNIKDNVAKLHLL